MVAYPHPAGLNPWQRFRQAGAILRGTSRASNPAWYLSALELDLQLHLRADGSRIDSRLFDRRTGQWSAGPAVNDSAATDLTLVPAFAAEVIAAAQRANANSIGVILHLADEFATSELKPELDNPGALAELRKTIQDDPKSVLDDSSVSAADSSWRLIPYPAAGSDMIATTICISRVWSAFLAELRKAGEQQNFPVITLGVSAPLICLLSLPALKTDELSRPLIAVLPYPRFTLLAFFNEHGDLRLLRTLQHRGQRRPTNLRHAASTTAAALELADPEVFLLNVGDHADPQLAADLQLVFPAASIREIDWATTPFHLSSEGNICPEPLIATGLAVPSTTPLGASHTFAVLRDEGWAVQDFLPVAAEAAEVYPAKGEMKLLRAARYARLAVVGLALLALGSFTMEIFGLIRQPEWAFDKESAKIDNQRLAYVTSERGRIDHWENLLQDRSKAWAAMELLSTLFPDQGGFLVRTFDHKTSTTSAPAQAMNGFSREWKITGLAREDALERLAQLNTRDGISAVFDEVVALTGNESFRTDLASRSLVVNIRTLENASYRPGPLDESSRLDDSTYPFSFDLTLTQRFESSDPMAINAAKAP